MMIAFESLSSISDSEISFEDFLRTSSQYLNSYKKKKKKKKKTMLIRLNKFYTTKIIMETNIVPNGEKGNLFLDLVCDL